MENVDPSSLQAELEFYRQNQGSVEQEIRAVIADNQRLSHQVRVLLQEKLLNARSDQDTLGSQDLRVQVALLAKERDSLHVLWQSAQKTIEALETELKTYQTYDNNTSKDHQHHNDIENIKDLELKLETSLSDYLELESKHKELANQLTSLHNDLNSKEREIATYKERGKQLEEKIEELSKVVEELRISLAAEKKSNEELKTQLHACQREAVGLVKKEAEAKSKVVEALQLFDAVTAQKNEACKKIAGITEELLLTKQLLETAHRDTSLVRMRELDEARQQYNDKMADMLAHMRSLDAELVEKGMLLNKALREVKVLQEVNASLVKERDDLSNTTDPKLALAQSKLDTVFQELVSSERRNILLVAEQQSLALDMQRTQDSHARELKRRAWEHQLVTTRCQQLEVQVEHLSKSLEETHALVDNLQHSMASRDGLTLKMVSSKEEELSEMNKLLEKQMELSKKWKESYVEMTDKLQKKLKDLQRENQSLRLQTQQPTIQSPTDEES